MLNCCEPQQLTTINYETNNTYNLWHNDFYIGVLCLKQ